MRTDLTAVLAGITVRGAVPASAWDDILGTGSYREFVASLNDGDPRVVRQVLRAAFRAAGDLKPLEIADEVDRLIEAAGVEACQRFAVRLIEDALTKAETAMGNSPAADGAGHQTPTAADTTPS